MYISIQKLRSDAQIPNRATPNSAGYDICALCDDNIIIQPGQIVRVPTGIAVAPSRSDVAICIFPRSGLSSKHGITLINSVGLVDSDYRGELQVPLINHGNEPFTIESGMRIAQLVVFPVCTPAFKEVSELEETVRGTRGFGASGLM